jgi:outer membrane protein OmpU
VGNSDLWLCCTNFWTFWRRQTVAVAIRGVRGEIRFIPLRIPLRRAYLEERGKNMKKVLLASSILAMTASFASAEVTLSGSARMGILNGFEFDPTADDETGFTSRARVEFGMSGETDGGLSFGAKFRADNAGGANEGTAGSVFASMSGFTISMGDVDGAANAAVGHVDGVGLTGLDDLNENLFVANGGLGFNDDISGVLGLALGEQLTSDPSVLVAYAAGDFGVYASATQPSFVGVNGEGDAYALGASYTFGDYKVSAGWESLDVNDLAGAALVDIDHWILGADATFGAVVVKARYGQADIDAGGVATADFEQLALSATYTVDALSVTAFAAEKEIDDLAGANIWESQTIGLGASYDLGGGAKVVGGIAQEDLTVGAGPSVDDTAFDLGLSFTF